MMSSSWSVLAKISVAFAVLLVLSLGLCGIAVATNGSQSTATLAIGGMVLGAAGLVLCGVFAVTLAIVSAFRKPPPPPPPPPL